MRGGRQSLIEVAPKISRAVIAILREHRASDGRLRALYYQTLKHMVRHLEWFVVTPGVSEAAQEVAEASGIGDLRQYRWGHQPNKMLDKGRGIFHWEHNPPVADIVKRLLEMEDPRLEEVEEVLLTVEVNWITKSQDDTLASHNRGNDPALAYAKIALRHPCVQG